MSGGRASVATLRRTVLTPDDPEERTAMQLMQYEITLPADYDMGIIHRRVAARGSGTDRFPGLGVKAYLVRQRGRHGSPVNQYAPFYVWSELSGMNQFLFGPGFDGIRTDFGRPAVRAWHGIAISDGPEHASAPVAATRTVRAIDPGLALPGLTGRLVDETQTVARQSGVNCTVTGVDPTAWQMVQLTLWSDEAPEGAPGEHFDVLHVSQPHRRDLPRPRS